MTASAPARPMAAQTLSASEAPAAGTTPGRSSGSEAAASGASPRWPAVRMIRWAGQVDPGAPALRGSSDGLILRPSCPRFMLVGVRVIGHGAEDAVPDA